MKSLQEVEDQVVLVKKIMTAIEETRSSLIGMGLTNEAATRIAFEAFQISTSPGDFAEPVTPLKRAA